MGLSDEERRSKLYYAVRGIRHAVRNWEEQVRDQYELDQCKELRDLTDQLWHSVFGKQTNGLHWFMGSSASNPVKTDDPSTPWEMGICLHLEEAVRKPNIMDRLDKNRPFNAVDFCDIPYLLTQAGERSLAGVFEVYAWIEQLIYGLRRYQDDFLTSYRAVDEIASKMLGECFDIFTRRSAYGQAYVIHQIIEILYGNPYPYQEENWDFVTRILSKHNIHHDMSKWMRRPMQEVCEIHKALVKRVAYAQDLAERGEGLHTWFKDRELRIDRLFVALRMGISIYEYDHIQKAILKTIEHAGGKRLRLRAERAMGRHKEEYKEVKKKEREKKPWERKDLNAYGWDAYREMDEFFKIEDERHGITRED